MWLRSLVKDSHDGSISSKRVVTLLAFVVCCWGFVADVMGYKVNPQLFDSMMYIVVAGLGFTASEKFSPLNNKNNKESE
jgi:hypothetical protein